jgi:hypothetical protein
MRTSCLAGWLGRAAAAALGGLALALCGCSSFERDWEALANAPPAAGELEGRWEGGWRSEATSHEGGLRCIVTRVEGDRYDMRYRATYRLVFCLLSFEYTVRMESSEEGGRILFRGEEDLGWLAGGRYTYEGEAGGGELRSRYRSSGDHGEFSMKRPQPRGAGADGAAGGEG